MKSKLPGILIILVAFAPNSFAATAQLIHTPNATSSAPSGACPAKGTVAAEEPCACRDLPEGGMDCTGYRELYDGESIDGACGTVTVTTNCQEASLRIELL